MAKILLVDDSALDRRLYTEILERESDFLVASCSDGEAALKAMTLQIPDVVLTDMQMPVMDGLELVTEVRRRFPNIPVILITGRGSEALATKALRAGAAGYVPKSHSGDLLTETIRHVLELGKPGTADARVNTSTSLVHYEFELDNDETLIPGVLQLTRERLTELGRADDVTHLQIEVALEHALQNAIYHGNLDFKQHAGVEFDHAAKIREAKLLNAQAPYSERRVHLVMHLTPHDARFVVRDEGDGFDVKEVSSLGLTHSLRGESGHGLFLMWSFMDKVVFDKTGNSVTLIKRFDPPSTTAAATDAQPEPAAKDESREVLATIRPKDGGRPFDLTRRRVTIGRDPSCDIVINSPAVSHHHCLLFLHEGWWFVRDLKSKNGIKVNGKQFPQHLVPPAALFAVGPHEFVVEYQPHKLGAVGITPPVDPF